MTPAFASGHNHAEYETPSLSQASLCGTGQRVNVAGPQCPAGNAQVLHTVLLGAECEAGGGPTFALGPSSHSSAQAPACETKVGVGSLCSQQPHRVAQGLLWPPLSPPEVLGLGIHVGVLHQIFEKLREIIT